VSENPRGKPAIRTQNQTTFSGVLSPERPNLTQNGDTVIDSNRIGSACWYHLPNISNRPNNPWRGGKLRAWSTDHEEFETGPGLIPVGVIEDDMTGECHSIYVANICFVALPPMES